MPPEQCSDLHSHSNQCGVTVSRLGDVQASIQHDFANWHAHLTPSAGGSKLNVGCLWVSLSIKERPWLRVLINKVDRSLWKPAVAADFQSIRSLTKPYAHLHMIVLGGKRGLAAFISILVLGEQTLWLVCFYFKQLQFTWAALIWECSKGATAKGCRGNLFCM